MHQQAKLQLHVICLPVIRIFLHSIHDMPFCEHVERFETIAYSVVDVHVFSHIRLVEYCIKCK